MIGVYTWKENGIQARVHIEEGNLVFDDRLIYPEDDFRMEYRGSLKKGNIMHGRGTLTLRNREGSEQKSYTGEWKDNVFVDEREKEL